MRSSTRNLMLIAMFAAVMSIMAQISIPLPFSPVPITGQTLALALLAIILPKKLSTSSVGIYLLLGAIGLPVFAGATGGLGILLGPSGGYLFALVIAAWLISAALEVEGSYKVIPTFIITTIGLLVVLLFGTVWMKFILHMSWTEAFWAGFAPFVILEVVKAGIATFVGLTVRNRLVKMKLL